MTDIQDANRFFFRFVSDEASFMKVEKEMETFDCSKAIMLEKPIKKGTLCVAKFSDDRLYRARVLGSSGQKGKTDVIFIDYGNTSSIDFDLMWRLPGHLAPIGALAK